MKGITKAGGLVLLVAILLFMPAVASFGQEAASTSGCLVLTNNLFWGSRDYWTNGQVTKLQVFLVAQGDLNHAPTGYFGILTWNAVRKFQREHNIISTGFVGPLTRAEIQRVSCGSTPTTKADIDSMSPTSGPVGTTVTLTGKGFTDDNTIKFGSGVIVHVPSYDNGTRLIFNVPEYLNPACYYSNPACMTASFAPSQQVTPGSYDVRVENGSGESNKKTFKVTDATLGVRLNTISPTQGPVGTEVTLTGTGFGNNNTIHLGQGVIYNIPSSNSGTHIKFLVPEYVSPYCRAGMYCIAIVYKVDPGDFDVKVETATSTSNKRTFTVTSSPTSGTLRITGLDAPNTLRVGQTGTWTVRVESGVSQQLSYSVRWGDEVMPLAQTASSGNVQNVATFTHSYTYPGTFTPTFTVTSGSGASATMSASVIVTNY